MPRRSLWDLPWTPDYLALEPEMRVFAVRTLAASDEEFQKLQPSTQDFVLDQLLVPISLTRTERLLRGLRIFGRRILWLGESWSGQQKREAADAARDFGKAVIERNTERAQVEAGLDPGSRLESGGPYENGKAAAPTAAGDPTSEFDSTNPDAAIH